MNNIVRPITADGRVGFDQFNQLVLETREGKYTTQIFISDVRDKTCSICLHGWKPTAESLKDQTYWRDFEEWTHTSCMVRYGALRDRKKFFEALIKARVRFERMKPIENKYWPKTYEDSKSPWYEIKLLDYPAKFILGWRKRVAQIELIPNDESIFDCELAKAEFEDEDVTKGFLPSGILLHAWSDEKVVEYVKRIVSMLPKILKLKDAE